MKVSGFHRFHAILGLGVVGAEQQCGKIANKTGAFLRFRAVEGETLDGGHGGLFTQLVLDACPDGRQLVGQLQRRLRRMFVVVKPHVVSVSDLPDVQDLAPDGNQLGFHRGQLLLELNDTAYQVRVLAFLGQGIQCAKPL